MSHIQNNFRIIMSDDEMNCLSEIIKSVLGIRMPKEKKVLLESRLQKRLEILKLSTFTQYCEYLKNANGKSNELVHMIDQVTTNKTDFFREAKHFEILQTLILPKMITQYKKRKIKVWSAGCSTGQEAYTLAMILQNFKESHFGFDYEIIATDISTSVLQSGIKAIYNNSDLSPIPAEFRKKYLLKSKESKNNQFRVKPILRTKVTFSRLNLMDKSYFTEKEFNIIFCRNVLIYFNKEKQEEIIERLNKTLVSGGHLFLGHSESLIANTIAMIQIDHTVYKLRD